MTDFYDGGPVYPQERMLPCGSHEDCEGISLRDYFAAKAMQGLVAGADPEHGINLPGKAEWSYKMADAMIKAREAV